MMDAEDAPWTADQYRAKLTQIDESLHELYVLRRAYMERFAAEFPVQLPPPARRTETQHRVARCPRCGGRIEDT